MNRNINKEINTEKLKLYFDEHPDISKKSIAEVIHRSKTFVNDVIRRGMCNILIMDTICDTLDLPHDYFDKKEEVEESKIKEVVEETNIHDDLMAILASNRKIEALLEDLWQYWRLIEK